MAQRGYEEVLKYVIQTAGGEEVTAMAKTIEELGKTGAVSAERAKKLADELGRLADTSGNIQRFTGLKAQLIDTGAALEKAKARASELRKEFEASESPSKRLERSLAAADRQVDKLEKTLNRQRAQLSSTSNALAKAGVDTNALSAAYSKLDGEVGELGAELAKAGARAVQAGRDGKAGAAGLGSIEKASKGSSIALKSIATRLGLVSAAAKAASGVLATFSGAALFSGALASARTLQDALTQVQAVSWATADEMERLKAAAEQGGAATRFSALEAAQGLGELARATGSADAAIAALPATLDLAQAAGIGVAEAAQLITTTLTQFGLGAEKASLVADVLAKAANSTTADVRGLGDALSYAAPLAKQLGLDAEQTVAIIGALADQGFRGERAGTALRNVFSELIDPSSAFAKGLRDIGIESTDFATVIEQLAEKGQEGRDALMDLDAAARPAILALVESGSTALRRLDTDLRNAGGSAEATARQIGNSFAGADESLRDTLDRTRRALVEPILEPLRVELLALSRELEEFAGSQDFAEIKGALKELFIEGAAAARELFREIDFKALAADIKSFVGDANATVTEFRENVELVVSAVELVGDAFSTIFNGVQTIILGAAAATAKLLEVYGRVTQALTFIPRKLVEFGTGSEELSKKLDEHIGGMGAIFDEFADRTVENFNETIASAKDFADVTGSASSVASEGLKEVAGASDAAATAAGATAEAANAAGRALAGQGAAAATAASQTVAAADNMTGGAERLRRAFADLGISSQRELQRTAEASKRSFDLVREAFGRGEATIEDVRRALGAYAQATRTAAAESDVSTRQRTEGELQVLEAIYDVNDGLDQMTARGQRAGRSVAAGAQDAANALSGAAASTQQTAGAAGQAAEGMKSVAKGAWEGREGLYGASQGAYSLAQGFGELSKEALRAYMATNLAISPLTSGGKDIFPMFNAINNVTDAIREQKEALDGELKAIDSAGKEFDELHERRTQLQQRFSLLGASQIEQLLQAERDLDQKRKARQEKEAREREAQRTADLERLGVADKLQQAAGGARIPVSDNKLTVVLEYPQPASGGELSPQERRAADRILAYILPRLTRELARSKSITVTKRPSPR